MSRNPLGRYSPWAWIAEPVRGCNLRCYHCTTRLWPAKQYTFMTMETWEAFWRTVSITTPRCRVEIANAGEPTLHPDLLQLLWVARKLSPESQIQITTNGITLLQGKVKYRDLFHAGVNIVYVDMYGPREKHAALAEESGVLWYDRYDCKGKPGPWTYHGPETKLIALMENPDNWPDKRTKVGRMGTFCNQLDWEAASKHGLVPVTEPLTRRCTQPYRYVSTNVRGEYMLCCQDMLCEVGGLGSVHEGVDGFKRFWFGSTMQAMRRELRNTHRGRVSICAKCRVTFSKSDFRMWDPTILSRFWDGEQWVDFDTPFVDEQPKVKQ